MRIKDEFLLREVAGSYIVVATGALTKEFNGIIKLNETGSFLWKKLAENTDVQALVGALTTEYDVTAEAFFQGCGIHVFGGNLYGIEYLHAAFDQVVENG